MKIAIIGSFNYHIECIGFLLEIFKNKLDKFIGCL